MQDSGYFQKMTEGLIHTYYLDQDWNAALSYFDRNQVSWIGVSDQAMALDYDKLKVFFENGCNSKYEIRLLDENYSMVSKGEDFAVDPQRPGPQDGLLGSAVPRHRAGAGLRRMHERSAADHGRRVYQGNGCFCKVLPE